MRRYAINVTPQLAALVVGQQKFTHAVVLDEERS